MVAQAMQAEIAHLRASTTAAFAKCHFLRCLKQVSSAFTAFLCKNIYNRRIAHDCSEHPKQWHFLSILCFGKDS